MLEPPPLLLLGPVLLRKWFPRFVEGVKLKATNSAIQPALTVTTTRPIGGIQAVSSTVSSPLATPTLAASGAESRFTISNLGSAAILGLVGAFLL